MVHRANLSGHEPEAPGRRTTTRSAARANPPSYPSPWFLPAPACHAVGPLLPWPGRTGFSKVSSCSQRTESHGTRPGKETL